MKSDLATYIFNPEANSSSRIIYVHGTMDRARAFLRVANHLADFKITAYDRRGYGRSVHLLRGEKLGIQGNLFDLSQIVSNQPCLLIGHSYGATLSLAFAAKNPTLVKAVIAYEPPLPWLNEFATGRIPWEQFDDPQYAAQQFLTMVLGDRYSKLSPKLKQRKLSEGNGLISDMHNFASSPAFLPEQITCPVLLGRGELTHERAQSVYYYLQDNLKTTTGFVIPGAGHIAHVTHPKEFALSVKKYLETYSR